MLNKRSILLISSLLTIGGCASPGPMQTAMGPMNTSAFEPVILDTVKDGSEKVHFKEWTTMYENKELQQWGVFFITDNGAYMAEWDFRGYEYNIRYKLLAKELDAVSDDKVVRDMWTDSNLLILQDKSGHKVGFALNGKNAARAILKEISAE
ncbi:hypothetical protein [Pseudoalteromonas sp. UBA2102]|uniref:hypothetical protein n=1 Tax=Pseudoalteromonas sp. UBA2102 TaxID=1947291 RepID=UPI00257BA8DC|nr:hypothetical protein [Pseudoalteromonas sp. UBA2102]|tara:strand:+ start:3792 stop:4247 length:456 start_codon:yes stop_codon:yes gene_type:complete